MGSRRSPMQMFRRISVNDDAKIPVTYKVSSEKHITFTDVRKDIFPIVKPWGWVKRATEALQTNGNCLISKPMTSLNLGTVYGVLLNNRDIIRYISNADLENWQITDKDLSKISKENFLKKIAYLERTEPLFRATQTGIYYCNKLQNLTASLLAVPEVFNMLPIKSNNTYVVLLPSSEFMLISHCQDARGLCVIGEINLRNGHREKLTPMPSKPIRVAKNTLSFYEASLVRNEASFPSTVDQLKTCKKSVFKRSRKISSS